MKKGRCTKHKISKYIVSGVLLFSMLGASGCDNKKLDELTKQVEELRQQIATFESLKTELQTQLAEAQALNAQLTELNNNKDLTIEELTTNVTTLTASVNSLTTQISSLNSQISTLQTNNAALQSQIATLEQQKQQAQNLIAQLNQQIAYLEAQLADLTTCTITFDLNYGDSLPPYDVKTVMPDQVVNRPDNDPIRDGYDFVKWVYGDLEVDWDFDNDKVNGDITLKAIWNAKTYNITFVLNGGAFDGVTPETTVIYDTMFTLPPVKKTNYTLARWTLNDETFESGIWDQTDDVTLECEWAKTSAQITYHYNYEGKADETQNVTYGANFTLKSPKRTGYQFLGWKYEGSYIKSGKWTYLDSIEVTAEWSAKNYTLYLDPVEGEMSGSDKAQVTFNENFTLPICEDLDEDRPFAGWFIENKRITDENGESLTEWNIDTNEDLTLEAKYFHVISSKDDFLAIGDNPSTTYGLVNDIDFEGVEVDSVDSFSGTLWGLGYSIKNVSFASDKTTVGLFKQLDGATIENINFKDSIISFNGTESSSTYYIGLLAAQAYGHNIFQDITATNISFDVELESGSAIAGGLVGIGQIMEIKRVSANAVGNVKSPGNSAYFGGFVGECTDFIDSDNYTFNGNIFGKSLGTTKDAYVGGLVGLSKMVTLEHAINGGNVAAESVSNDSAYAGGIIGKNTERTEMKNCANDGGVTSSKYAGGLIGYNSVSASKFILDDCYNNGAVDDSASNGYVGGLIGRCSDNISLTSVFNIGDVSSTDGYAGGLVGKAEADIIFDSCCTSGNVYSGGVAGGFVGYALSSRIYDSYSVGLIEGYSYVGGFIGESTQSDISKSYVGGIVKVSDGSSDGFVGGFIGKTTSSNLNNLFIFADLIGNGNKTNSYIGKCDGAVVSLTYSAATLKDQFGSDIEESDYPVVNKVDLSTFTVEFITNTLQFSETKWNIEFDYDSDIYPTLKCFD